MRLSGALLSGETERVVGEVLLLSGAGSGSNSLVD